MPLPTLKTDFASPADSYMKAIQAKNYLLTAELAKERGKREAELYELEKEKSRQATENAILERQRENERFQREKETWETDDSKAELEKRKESARQMTEIAGAPTKEIGKKLAGIYGVEVEYNGPKITVTNTEKGYKIEGPAERVAEISKKIAEDPTWTTGLPMPSGPKGQQAKGSKRAHLRAYAAARGVTWEDLSEKGEGDVETWKTPEGKVVNLKKGEMPPQGSTKVAAVSAEPKKATTAMGAYLEKNPDATPDDIANYAKKLKQKEAEGQKAGTGNEPEVKPGDALKQIQEIEEKRAKVVSGELDTSDLMKMSFMKNILSEEELAQYAKKKELSEDDKKRVVSALDRRKEYLEVFAPERKLDKDTAKQILSEAGGDKDKARKLAKERGYSF